MSDPVIVALIGCAQAVTVAFVGVLAVRIGKVRRDTTATREHVVNDHTTNFRDENDSRHDETRGWFHELRRDVGGIREEIRGLRRDDRAIAERVARIEERGNP